MENQNTLTKLSLIISILSAGFMLYLNMRFGVVKEKLGAQSQQLSIQQSTLEIIKTNNQIDEGKKKFDRDFKFEIIDRVLKVIHDKDQAQLDIVSTMVTAMLSDDPETQKALLTRIAQSSSPNSLASISAKAAITTLNSFSTEEKTVVADDSLIKNKPSSAKYRIDIFYLEDNKEKTESQATNLKSILEKFNLYSEIRVRILPAIVNQRAGYQLIRNEIRYDSNEQSASTALNEKMKTNGYSFDLHQSFSNTPGYMSIFIVQ